LSQGVISCMVSCRHPNCNDELESKRGRSIHESKVHGEVLHDTSWDEETYLREEYVENGRTMKDIANEHDVPYNTIRDAILNYGIETRNPDETRYFDRRKMLRESIDDIKNRYVNEKQPAYEIANEYNVDDATITRLLKEAGVDVRNVQEQHLATTDYPKLTDYNWLWEEYRNKEKYTPEIAEELGCSVGAVYNAILRHDIPVWEHGETISGEKNAHWNGGRERYYGPNWTEKRENAIQSNNEQCKACGMGREKHKEVYGSDIEVHHITPIKEFDDPEAANKVENLVPLCKSCHKTWEGIPVMPQ